jgi:RNA 3'-terminal phosphate cyclase (ATP)
VPAHSIPPAPAPAPTTGRKNPGLSPQHLTGLRLVAAMCRGRLTGAAVRSSEVALTPGPLTCGAYLADTGTAGSCTLMVQQALPCMLFATPAPEATADAAGCPLTGVGAADLSMWGDDPGSPSARWSHLDLRGGTDAAFAPPVGYLTHVLAPTLHRLLPPSAAIDVRLGRRGFYPKGGGRVGVRARAVASGERLPAINVTRRGQVRAGQRPAGRAAAAWAARS